MDNVSKISKLWEQYDRKLSETLNINKNILREIHSFRIQSQLNKPLFNEGIELVIILVLMPLLINFSIDHANSPRLFLSGALSFALVLFFFILSVIRIKKFLSAGQLNDSIIETQKRISQLKLTVLRTRKIEYLLLPLLVATLLPISGKILYHINLFEKPFSFGVALTFALGIGILGTILTNRYYNQKIETAESFLKKIKTYENENIQD